MRRNKYGAIKTKVDNITFASKGEATRYLHLKALQQAGKISNLETHPKFDIVINGKKVCVVELDFYYINENGEPVWEDFKGRDNAMSRLKRKLVEAAYDIKVLVVKS